MMIMQVPAGDRKFNYVYVNGSVLKYKEFEIAYSIVDSTNLKITDTYPTDSGFYDCYETDGERIVGYYLVVEGMSLAIFTTTTIIII